MRVILISSILVLSFIAMIGTCESMNFVFWFSFLIFAASSIYIEKNQKMLEIELDNLFHDTKL